MSDPSPAKPRARRNRRRSPALEGVSIPELDAVRFGIADARDALADAADRLSLPKPGFSRSEFNILAVSGGAAGGAFGAGLLVGLTRSGRRPTFAIVTGVSTGALIAPFAFLGPDWDERLTDAYTGGYASQLLRVSSFGSGIDAGIFRRSALEALISRFIDEEMLTAVARAHALGRRLLVATTDLDSQRTCIWDMGAIATRGGEDALALFRNVLVASASLPGIFPPKLIGGEIDGVRYDEMHVDGGLGAPLFIMPEALLHWRQLGSRLRRGRVYVIINTILEPAPQVTQANVASVLIRSFDAMLRHSYRQALSTTATFCAAARLPLSVASIPPDPSHGSMMNFDTASMRRMFAAAADGGPDLWTSAPVEPDVLSRVLAWPRLTPKP